MAEIKINGISFDPVREFETSSEASLEDASASNYILIQTAAPLTSEQKSELSDFGGLIQEYVSENTYLCSYEPSDLDRIRRLPYVIWAGVYLPGFKIPPKLRRSGATLSATVSPIEVIAAHSTTLHKVDVVLHEDVNAESDNLKSQIAAAARINVSNLQMSRHKVRLVVQEQYLGDLAAIDEVHHIEEVTPVKLFNNVARPILNADVIVNGTSYQGDGEVIAVADTGFDSGSTVTVHPAFAGRVLNLYALGRTNPDQTDDPDGHGTHVAGSALGDGFSSLMGGTIQGTAPQAQLVLQSLLDVWGDLGGLPTDLNDLFDVPYQNDGARVHTNSWGSRVGGLPYDQGSREIDEFVWNHQDCVICFSAGNHGIDGDGDGIVDPSSISSQGAAKNCITVGASESVRAHRRSYNSHWSGDFPANPIANDLIANNADGMVAFSSRGPTLEGRFKPDVVAPGTCILSTRSQALSIAPTNFGGSLDTDYFFQSGTSMATPLTAGCLAVLREGLVKNGTPTPSAALLKAMLINGAVELPGQYNPSEAGESPNNNSGFGRVNLTASVIIPGPDPDSGFGEGDPLNEGDEDTIIINIPEERPRSGPHRVGVMGGSPITLKITLVWTDPPGAMLQNDLDLIVVASDGQERHGNMGVLAGFDRDNNVEQIIWNNIPSGQATVTVRAFRITAFAQPYAYAWRIS